MYFTSTYSFSTMIFHLHFVAIILRHPIQKLLNKLKALEKLALFHIKSLIKNQYNPIPDNLHLLKT